MESDFRLLFEASPHPYLVLQPDAAFTISAVNDRYLAATSTRRPDILGRGLFEVFPDNPDDTSGSGVSDLRISLERVLRDKVQDIMGVQKYDIPREGVPGEFEVKYWSPVNTPVFGADGGIEYIIHHVEDVTEFMLARERSTAENATMEDRADRMEAEVARRAGEVKTANRRLKAMMEELQLREAELARLNEQLTSLDRAKTAFFSNVSHEFRTPLTLLLGPLEDELAEVGLPAARRARLEIAHRNSLRLLKLVNALLDFARIEAGRAQAAFEPTDLANLTTYLASNFHSACERAGLGLRIDCPPLPEPVYVDRDMWEKIVLNLLSNAFKFTLRGKIAVSLKPSGEYVELTVGDTGVGIPEDELPHIFDRFHRAKAVEGRTHEGSGIGLALIRELVALNGGQVLVESDRGKGSTFTVRIPRGKDHLPADLIKAPGPQMAAATAAEPFVEESLRWLTSEAPVSEAGDTLRGEAEPADASLPGPPYGQKEGPGPRIIWADDNADMRDYVQRLLSVGYDVEAVANGEEALAAARRKPPELILTDVMMPRLDGFGLLRELRADEGLQTVPVILLSARAGEEARVDGLTAGADDYLVKPFSGKELLAKIGSTLGMAALRREVARREATLQAMRLTQGKLRTMVREQRATNTRLQREIVERRAVEAQLITAKEGAEAANKSKSEFLANMSHEIRTPLNGVMGMLQVMEMSPLDDDQKKCLVTARKSSQRLAHLLSDILDLSRIEAGKLVFHETPFRVANLQNALVELFAPAAREKGLDLDFSFGDRMPALLMGDENRLVQILFNLVGNAIKFTGSGTVRVEVAPLPDAAEARPRVLFTVSDTGIGIPGSQLKNIFEPFAQAEGSYTRRFQGAGLGLSIVRKLVKIMHGELCIDSVEGEGTAMYLSLPFKLPDERPGQAEPMAAAGRSPAAGTGPRILFAEDDSVNVTVGNRLLEKSGYAVTTAGDGREVLKLLAGHSFDLILMDVHMPVMDGVEATRRIRASGASYADTPIVAMTAYAMAGDKEKFLAAGMNDYIAKPVKLEELKAVIERVLNGAASR